MGALATCEHCGCLGGNDTFSIKRDTQYDTSDSSSDEEVTTDEETELIKNNKNKNKKNKRQNKERDESYILYSDDDSDSNKIKKSKQREEVVAKVQQSIMERSKNEVDKHSGLYGMDKKTMELLMNVNLSNQPPQPPMPSIASQPLASMDSNMGSVDYKHAPPEIDTTNDMSLQLKKYTSNDMISETSINNNELQKQDSYNTLVVDEGDNTPALPLNEQNNNNINNKLGNLDYDFDQEHEDANIEPLNTLRLDEKDINDMRIKNIVLKANHSRGPDEIEKLIKQQYTHKLHESHEEEITDDESSYEEHEKQEIERMKTEEMNKKPKKQMSKAKLFRPNTTTAWDEDDMDNMRLAMTKEMEAMVERQQSKESPNNPMINMEFESDSDSEEAYDTMGDDNIDEKIKIKTGKNDNMNAGTKTSRLFRVKSTYKWDKQRVEQENKDMQAHLADLMIAHQSSIETDPMKQPNLLPYVNNEQ